MINLQSSNLTVKKFESQCLAPKKSCVIIDSGVFKIAAGYEDGKLPSVAFRSIVAKMKREKSKEAEVLVGEEIPSLEAARAYLKLPFEKNVIVNGDAYETVLMFACNHLGLDSSLPLTNSLVIMEPLCNPPGSREISLEVIFNSMNFSSVTFGVDAAFSYYYHQRGKSLDDALIISLGHTTCHVIPFLGGRMDISHAKRLSIGGYNLAAHLQRVMQLKYPMHSSLFSYARSEELMYDHCYVSTSFLDELRLWMNPEYYKENVKRIEGGQPVQAPPPPGAYEALREKRKALGKKLAQMQRRKREQRLAGDATLHVELLSLKESLSQYEDEDEIQMALERHGFTSVQSLTLAIKKLGESVEKESLKLEEAKSATTQDSAASKLLGLPEGESIESWISRLQGEKEELIGRRSSRRQKRAAMAKRRTAAGQERMRIISQLAAKQREKEQDDFGARDEDWDVYKAISTEGGSDSEAENERIAAIDVILTHHGALETQEEIDQSIHFGNERIRIPEILFQPSIAGLDQMGIIELANFVISRYNESIQLRLAENIFITGGLSAFTGLKERVETDLRALRPFKSRINVSVSEDPLFGAWKGAKHWYQKESDPSHFIKKEDYIAGKVLGKPFCASNNI